MENEHIEEKSKGLKKIFKKIKKWKKRTKIIVSIILIVVLFIVLPILLKKKELPYALGEVIRDDVVQEVSATGTVEAAEEVDLRFKTGGIIESILYKTGDKVSKGAYIVRLSSGGVYSQFLQAQASYNQAKAKLDQLLAGSTNEEINVAQQVLENADIALEDAQAKADNDLTQDYNSALVSLLDASSKCNKAIADLKDVEKEYFYRSAQLDNTYKEKRALAQSTFANADELTDTAISDPAYINVDLALAEMKSAVQKTIDALNYAKTAMADPAVREDVAAADKAIIDANLTNINTAYSNISGSITNIANQKITNKTDLNSAESIYNKALVDLQELQAPPRNVDIAVFQADVDKYQANMSEFSQKLRDASIIAPFSGIVAKIDGKVGEVMSANDRIVVSLISPGGFQIKADISEADISKVDLEDPVKVILDAFPEQAWTGNIVEIEPAETVIDGVVYYRIKVMFEQIDEKARSGMTADVTIQSDKKENVLQVPYRAIVFKDGKRLVRILDNGIQEIEVVTGLKGSNGEIEILSGLNQGQEIITFMKK